jgi:hypothetical protein
LGEGQGFLCATHLVFRHVGQGLVPNALDVLARDVDFEDIVAVVDEFLEDPRVGGAWASLWD